jgi:hypothetical protein
MRSFTLRTAASLVVLHDYSVRACGGWGRGAGAVAISPSFPAVGWEASCSFNKPQLQLAQCATAAALCFCC